MSGKIRPGILFSIFRISQDYANGQYLALHLRGGRVIYVCALAMLRCPITDYEVDWLTDYLILC